MPNTTASADRRVGQEHVLDLGRGDVLAAADDHLLDPPDEAQVAVLEHALVAGPEPAVAERFGVRLVDSRGSRRVTPGPRMATSPGEPGGTSLQASSTTRMPQPGRDADRLRSPLAPVASGFAAISWLASVMPYASSIGAP